MNKTHTHIPTFNPRSVAVDLADRVYDVLIRLAGASEQHRFEFVVLAGAGQLSEFRFGGSLGWGGKVRYSRPRGFYVDCYREHLNDERRAVIERTNRALSRFATEGPQDGS